MDDFDRYLSTNPLPRVAAVNGRRLCRLLGVELLRVLTADAPEARAIRSVVIGDPGHETPDFEAGDLVLGVAAATPDAQAQLIRRAARAGAAGIVIKVADDSIGDLIDAADGAGVELLATSREVSWGRLYELLASALSADRAQTLPPAGEGSAADLFALADATALATGAPVTIEDATSHVLAFSADGQDVDSVRVATILGRQVPGPWARRLREQAELANALAGEEPVTIELAGMAPRRVIPIRSGGTLLGSIWLAGATAATADDALREAAAIAALHLLRHQAERDRERAARSAAAAEVLSSGRLSGPVATETGLLAGDGFAVVALALEQQARDGALEQVSELLAQHLRAFRRRAVHALLDGRGYVLAAVADEQDHAMAAARLRDGLARARRVVGVPVRAGIGLWTPDAAGLPRARRTADRALELGERPDVLVPFEEVHAVALLRDVNAHVRARDDLPSRAFRALTDHDRTHGTALATTLLVVLEVFGDTAIAARRLHVHANTVRYRVRQATELTGIQLTDPVARLPLELELRAQLSAGPE